MRGSPVSCLLSFARYFKWVEEGKCHAFGYKEIGPLRVWTAGLRIRTPYVGVKARLSRPKKGWKGYTIRQFGKLDPALSLSRSALSRKKEDLLSAPDESPLEMTKQVHKWKSFLSPYPRKKETVLDRENGVHVLYPVVVMLFCPV